MQGKEAKQPIIYPAPFLTTKARPPALTQKLLSDEIAVNSNCPAGTTTYMKITLVVLCTLLALPLWALDDTTANREEQAARYLQATPPKELFQDMAEQVAKTLPPEQRGDFKALFLKYLDIDAITKAMKESLVKNFTADELKAVADFYLSPVGKSAMKKMGLFMADLMPTIQAETIKAQAKANRDKN
jgi:hypothetical protein